MRPPLALLLGFDGVVCTGDLPVLAYARHCAETDTLAPAGATALIDGIRFFLEGKSVGRPIDGLRTARSGRDAVEMLAAAAGLTAEQVKRAHHRSREDLAASAFALDAPDGLADLLDRLPGVVVTVVTTAGPVGVTEVLDAVGLRRFVSRVVLDDGPPGRRSEIVRDALDDVGATGRPGRLMAVADRWAPDLAEARRLGTGTALVDRFGTGGGEPDLRAATPSGLLAGIAEWADRDAR